MRCSSSLPLKLPGTLEALDDILAGVDGGGMAS